MQNTIIFVFFILNTKRKIGMYFQNTSFNYNSFYYIYERHIGKHVLYSNSSKKVVFYKHFYTHNINTFYMKFYW